MERDEGIWETRGDGSERAEIEENPASGGGDRGEGEVIRERKERGERRK